MEQNWNIHEYSSLLMFLGFQESREGLLLWSGRSMPRIMNHEPEVSKWYQASACHRYSDRQMSHQHEIGLNTCILLECIP